MCVFVRPCVALSQRSSFPSIVSTTERLLTAMNTLGPAVGSKPYLNKSPFLQFYKFKGNTYTKCTHVFDLLYCRSSFPSIVNTTERLLTAMAAVGPTTPHDMDMVSGRLTVDVIGSFGFGRDFGATDLCKPSEVLTVIRHLTQAMQARNNPLNRWFPWRKVRRRWGGEGGEGEGLGEEGGGKRGGKFP